jgi:two-component system NtrC family sensor kinase
MLDRLARWLTPRVRLWVQLAIFGAIGVVITHSVNLAIARRITARALTEDQARLGRSVARVLAHEVADPLLVNDVIVLHELVANTVASKDVAYCFVVKDGKVVASSFAGKTPEGLLRVRSGDDVTPVIVTQGEHRYLDVVEPVVEAAGAQVRVGLDMAIVRDTGRTLASMLGLVAIGVIIAGSLTAFVVGRLIARPVGRLLDAADRFDPSLDVQPVPAEGSDEIAEVTERFNKMMERLKVAHDEQLEARKRAIATERMAALGSLVGGVAHEVNNPLAGLKNCVRRLERDDLSPEKRREYLELMDEGLTRIGDVVHHMLDFGKPRALRLGEVAVDSLGREELKLVAPLLRKRGIELRDERVDDRPVLADGKQLGQAFLNLVLNAAYVTPTGGQIRIVVRSRGELLAVAVEDDGPGIPPEIRGRVTLPYFTTKPEGEGTGLGLSVTRTIVDAHGGELAFECPPHGGTVATIWLRRPLPLIDEPTAAS